MRFSYYLRAEAETKDETDESADTKLPERKKISEGNTWIIDLCEYGYDYPSIYQHEEAE